MSAFFRLIFRGQIASGSDPDKAAQVLAQRFRLEPALTQTVMSGRKVALARSLTEAAAFSLQAELEQEGILTRIEQDPDSPQPPGPAPAAYLSTREPVAAASNNDIPAITPTPPTQGGAGAG